VERTAGGRWARWGGEVAGLDVPAGPPAGHGEFVVLGEDAVPLAVRVCCHGVGRASRERASSHAERKENSSV
jgi:hypothetical protein